MASPSVKLNSGYELPTIGLGTWKSANNAVQAAVEAAIDCGYRHIDCAWLYQNEEEVGNAIEKKIKEKKVKREDLFITTKLWVTFNHPDRVRKGLMKSLKNLKLDYIDLYLIHFPVAHHYIDDKTTFPQDKNGESWFEDTDYVDTWKALEALQKEGLIRSIGVSNFNEYQIDRILKEGSIKPAMNQIEIHAYMTQNNLVNYCKKVGIDVTAYSPLGSGDRVWKQDSDPVLLEDPKLSEMSSRLKKSVAQILIKYLLQRGLIVIPKSVTTSRIKQNIEVFDFQLSKEDMDAIGSLNRDFRTCHWFDPKHKYNPFAANYSE